MPLQPLHMYILYGPFESAYQQFNNPRIPNLIAPTELVLIVEFHGTVTVVMFVTLSSICLHPNIVRMIAFDSSCLTTPVKQEETRSNKSSLLWKLLTSGWLVPWRVSTNKNLHVEDGAGGDYVYVDILLLV